jgi:hypothetical protein
MKILEYTGLDTSLVKASYRKVSGPSRAMTSALPKSKSSPI